MPQLVNTQTNILEEIPQDNFHEAITSGKYNLIKGEPINVLNPSGELVSLPAEQVPEALKSNFSIPSQQDITAYSNKLKYETTPEQAKTFAEGVASGATFGVSRELESQLFKNAAEQKARQEINPALSTTGEITGAVGSMLLAPEIAPTALSAKVGANVTRVAEPILASATKMVSNPESSAVVAKILEGATKAGAHTLGSAVDASVYGLGQSISEHALGDTELNAENVMHNVGYAALFGGALGGALGIARDGIVKAAPKNIETAALKDSIIENAAKHPENPTVSIPTSMEDIAKRVEEGKNLGFTAELPQKQTLLDAEQVLAGESNFPAHALQAQSLESPFVRDYYKSFLEGGSKDAQAMQAYEAFQKKEGVQLLNKFVKDISPVTKAAEDAVEGGNKLVKAFKEQYDAERAELKPLFEKFDSASVAAIEDPAKIIAKINEAVPEAGQFIYKTPDAGFSIQPYKSSMPVSKEAHRAISDLLDQLNDPKLTLGGLRNIREAMRDQVNFLTAPRTANEISSLRKSLMDIIQDEIQRISPDLEVREAFRKYAINEENRKIMERIFGGSISDQATFAKEIKPEEVLGKLFSNTVAVKAAKDILGEKFNSAAADYLMQNIARFTDPAKNGFSSNRFASFLKAKGPELEEALSQRPEALAKIKAITDKLRILPDSPSINPSGTAKTSLLQKMQQLGGYLTPKGLMSIPGEALRAASKHFEGAKQAATIEDILSGKTVLHSEDQLTSKRAQYGALAKIERMAQETTRKINKGASNIFDTLKPVIGIISTKLTPEKFEKTADKIRTMSNNFERGAEALENATSPIHSAAPSIAANLNIAAARATQFLASKLPIQDPGTPFSAPTKPSASEIAKFNRYYEIVENPVGVLSHIKNGTLTKEHLETIRTVYPKMYTQMQHAIMDKIAQKGGEHLPYQTKLTLSMFLGQDLTRSLKQASISSAQQVFATQGKAQPQRGMPTAGALSNITKSNQTLTEVQKIENK